MKIKAKSSGARLQHTAAGAPAPSPRQTIAWQKIVLHAPQSWSLVAVSGDERSGSLRVEQTGADESAALLGLQMRWSYVKHAQTDAMLDRRVKPLLDEAAKTAKRLRIDAETGSVAFDDRRHPERESVREFSWKADTAAVGRIWRCSECGRLVIAQAHYRGGVQNRQQARDLLEGLTCHNADAGWTRWAFFGLDVYVPEDYVLAGQKLMTIYVELTFTRGRGGKNAETLSIEQWSAANVQLKGAYLDEWIELKGRSLKQPIAVSKTETTLNDHPALEMTGSRGGLSYWVGNASRSLASLTLPPRWYSGIAWECPDSNKVYLVQATEAKKDGQTARDVAGRIVCHQRSDILAESSCP